MTMQKQIGILLDLVFDVVGRDESTKQKQAMILDMIEKNDRYEDPFTEFISWFKIEEGEE